MQPDSIPLFPQPVIYAGNFNCHSTTWGYKQPCDANFQTKANNLTECLHKKHQKSWEKTVKKIDLPIQAVLHGKLLTISQAKGQNHVSALSVPMP
jgi:uncharacterized protein YceK